MSKIHLIGGEKGGVGKSVVARLLVQWAVDKQLPFAAVDADESHGALLRHYGTFTRAVDLARPESADEIVSLALDADRRVIVDLPAQSDRLVAAWLAEAGVLDLLAEAGVGVVFWHVMDDGKDSIATLGRLLERHAAKPRANVRFVIVENLGRGKEFSLFDRSPARAAANEAGALTIQLPELQAPAMRKIDRSDGSFWAAVHNPEFAADLFTRMDRQRIKAWMVAVYDQLARLGDVA
ncbi:MAG TPA: mobilization protein [Polyangia bacterium]|nr:mobilization protein [Polyangia bacterium]